MAKVSEEVTRRLFPTDTNNKPFFCNQCSVRGSSGFFPPVLSTTGQSDAVQGSISTAQSASSGELQVVNLALTSQLFTCPSLPIDSFKF